MEFGLGGCKSTRAILDGLRYNGKPFKYVLVDNWHDWDGQKPEVSFPLIEFVTANEGDYVAACTEKFDFIMSDGDHDNADKWFDKVWDMLNPGGILVYHDVCSYPNLSTIVDRCKGLSHRVFNQNSIDGERCDRGLLVVFK